MAITQVDARKQGIGNINPKSADSTNDVFYTTLGGIWIMVGEGNPSTGDVKDAPKGSLYIQTDGAVPRIHVKKTEADINSVWTDLSALS
jgi:hypothetical protein